MLIAVRLSQHFPYVLVAFSFLAYHLREQKGQVRIWKADILEEGGVMARKQRLVQIDITPQPSYQVTHVHTKAKYETKKWNACVPICVNVQVLIVKQTLLRYLLWDEIQEHLIAGSMGCCIRMLQCHYLLYDPSCFIHHVSST